jgi:hypothetical protein
MLQFSAVIAVVTGQLPRRKSRPLGYPDVPLSFLIQGPSDATAHFCRDQIRRKRGAQHLLDRQRALRANLSRAKQTHRAHQREATRHRQILLEIALGPDA